ncbi:MAG: DNA methyltransferase [Gemmatimonadota bacterium]
MARLPIAELVEAQRSLKTAQVAKRSNSDTSALVRGLAEAARDCARVSGWTHNFYRYPARFSPRFANAAIQLLTMPGDVVFDPYMGGGTSVVEAMALGRHAVGNDLNSLAVFIAKAKTTPLSDDDVDAVTHWRRNGVPNLKYDASTEGMESFADEAKTKNLSLPRARFIKKAISIALSSLDSLQTIAARDFVRCVILRVGQWALDGRQGHTALTDFRGRLQSEAAQMLAASGFFASRVRASGGSVSLLNLDATSVDTAPVFKNGAQKAALVVTSPPYPGVHVLYHRWQVDGRRETPAPYWIAGCNDGKGASYYNFGDRRQGASDDYFAKSLLTLGSIRRVVRAGGYVVQLLAFNRPADQLPRYLSNMSAAGFSEVRIRGHERIWREVPNRKWHASLRGLTESAKEVVLIHRAI